MAELAFPASLYIGDIVDVYLPFDWISTETSYPSFGQTVVLLRMAQPGFFWVGVYDEEGMPKNEWEWFDYWLPLPRIPKCKGVEEDG